MCADRPKHDEHVPSIPTSVHADVATISEPQDGCGGSGETPPGTWEGENLLGWRLGERRGCAVVAREERAEFVGNASVVDAGGTEEGGRAAKNEDAAPTHLGMEKMSHRVHAMEKGSQWTCMCVRAIQTSLDRDSRERTHRSSVRDTSKNTKREGEIVCVLKENLQGRAIERLCLDWWANAMVVVCWRGTSDLGSNAGRDRPRSMESKREG